MSRWGWAAVVGVVAVGLGLLGFGLTRYPFVLPSPLVSGPAPQFRLEVMEPPELGPGARWRPPSEHADSVRLADLKGCIVVVGCQGKQRPPAGGPADGVNRNISSSNMGSRP